MQTPGMKSSEFYVTIVMVVIGLLNKILGWDLNAEEIATVYGPGLAYVASRGLAKIAK